MHVIVHLLLIGKMPTPAELSASGIKTGPSGGKGKEKASPLLEAMEKFRKAGVEGGEEADLSALSGADTTSLVQLGCGLAALSKKLLEKIEAGEYVDFSELPPAKGKGRSIKPLKG